MASLLLIVRDTFQIEGRGLLLEPGIILSEAMRVHAGDSILLRRPDRTEINWQIAGCDLMMDSLRENAWFVWLVGLTKDDVPTGTEVWSVDHDGSSTKQD